MGHLDPMTLQARGLPSLPSAPRQSRMNLVRCT